MADILVVPAYGREYNSLKSAKADWEDGKDFKMTDSSQYINKSDYEKYGKGAEVWLRYARLTKKGQLV